MERKKEKKVRISEANVPIDSYDSIKQLVNNHRGSWNSIFLTTIELQNNDHIEACLFLTTVFRLQHNSNSRPNSLSRSLPTPSTAHSTALPPTPPIHPSRPTSFVLLPTPVALFVLSFLLFLFPLLVQSPDFFLRKILQYFSKRDGLLVCSCLAARR